MLAPSICQEIIKEKTFSLLEILMPIFLPVNRVFDRIPVIGKYLKRSIPVASYDGLLPLNEIQLREWVLLDAFGWLSPAYDNPQTSKSVRLYMERALMERVEVLKAGHLVARGRKPLQ